MRPSTWQPPVEISAAEDLIIKRIKRAKLFTFLRHYRHQIFTPEFQVELAGIYKDSPPGQPPVEPARLFLNCNNCFYAVSFSRVPTILSYISSSERG